MFPPATPGRTVRRALPPLFLAAVSLLLLTGGASAQQGWTELNETVQHAGAPSLTQDDDGTFWLVFDEMVNNNEEIFAIPSDDLQDWREPTFVTTHNDTDFHPFITTAENGDLVTVWTSLRDKNYEVYLSRSEDGEEWSEPQRLTRDPESDWYPSVTQLSDGRLAVTFSSRRSGENSVYLITSRDGETWSDPVRVTHGEGDTYPMLTEKDGEYYLIFVRRTGDYSTPHRANEHDLFVTRSDDLQHWSNLGRLTTSPPGAFSLYPAVTVDDSGTLWVSYTSDAPGNEEVFLTRTDDGETWMTPIRLTRNVEYLEDMNSSGSFKADIKSMIQTREGDLVIAFESFRNLEGTRFIRVDPELGNDRTYPVSYDIPDTADASGDREDPARDGGETPAPEGGDGETTSPGLGLLLGAAGLLVAARLRPGR